MGTWRDRDGPRWSRPGLLLLLLAAAGAYTWALDASGYGNEYYAAAAYSGSQNWTAWLFGSLDSASFISVDKPPLSLWVTGLSTRMFGLSSWSVLLPHAIAGVATIGILYRTVRSWHGHAAALLAGAALAVTPIAAVMFRYNNPDAFLTLLMVSAIALAYSATQRGSGWRLAAAGALIGLAFLTKTTQALLVIPAIAIGYLVAAPISLRKRIAHGFGAGIAAVLAAGWWIVLAETSPAAPYFGQTSTGSFLDYVLGVNGLDRVTGSEFGGPDRFGGSGGWGRLFNEEVGGQISWLIPLAVAGLLFAVWRYASTPRTDSVRAGWLIWGTVFVTHFIVFGLMHGVFHPYYSMSMAPAIAALAAAGGVEMWRMRRDIHPLRWLLPTAVVLSAAWAWVLLGRSPGFVPWLGPVVLLGAVAGSAALVAGWSWARLSLRVEGAVGALLIAVSLAGPAAFALASIGADYSGGDPKAGPGMAEARSLPVGGQASGPVSGAPAPHDGVRPVGLPRPPARPGYPAEGADRPPAAARDAPARVGSQSVSGDVVEFLVERYDSESWLVATVGSQAAASIILDTGEPAMAMGGFSGGDPTPTADELAEYIQSGALRFVLLGGGRNSGEWEPVVTDLCSPTGIGGPGATLYDCAG